MAANPGRVWRTGINTWAALVAGGVTYMDTRYAAVRAAMGARG
jgi:hypothetical protein